MPTPTAAPGPRRPRRAGRGCPPQRAAPGAPRLLLLPDDVARLQGVIAGDATARGYRDALLRSGERMLGSPSRSGCWWGLASWTPAGAFWSRSTPWASSSAWMATHGGGIGRWPSCARRRRSRTGTPPTSWTWRRCPRLRHRLRLAAWGPHRRGAGHHPRRLDREGLRPADAYARPGVVGGRRFNWNNVCNGGIATAPWPWRTKSRTCAGPCWLGP